MQAASYLVKLSVIPLFCFLFYLPLCSYRRPTYGLGPQNGENTFSVTFLYKTDRRSPHSLSASFSRDADPTLSHGTPSRCPNFNRVMDALQEAAHINWREYLTHNCEVSLSYLQTKPNAMSLSDKSECTANDFHSGMLIFKEKKCNS